ncbi:hypothetical protein Q7P37_002450 [Cladosporium fusiforme]
MAMELSTPPPASPSKRHNPNMSLDLSDLPPLSQPTPPSNTLLITNLQSLEIFTSAVLESISQAINDHATIHIFAPLKSFRRIVVSFYTVEDAVAIRKVLDGESVLGNRVRVYFGQQTKIGDEEKYLHLPKSDKLFFISPPPSPPMGWQMRDEEPPNKEVHAEDLAAALSKLHARPGPMDAMDMEDDRTNSGAQQMSEFRPSTTRTRSGTGTVVYHPQDHGDSPALPAIEVEDTTDSPGDISPPNADVKLTHTARPPVELM